MPLLHRRPFIRQEPPADLSPDEEVFLCRITHEVFRSYDEFFERTILCNSLVWSCALTGRAGLTYLEAVESERRARLSLQNFPSVLVVPLLHLAALGHRGRLSELCEDVHAFVKERFFAGERVDVSGHNGTRRVCEILQVLPPQSSTNGTSTINGHSASADGDTIVISDSDEEDNAFQSPTAQVNTSAGERSQKKPLSPSLFKYEVRTVTDGRAKPFVVKANQISRRKNVVSRERLKLLFKQHCEPANGTIRLKASSVSKYRLSEQNFSQFFPDEPPQFPFSPGVKGEGRGSPAQASTSLLKVDKEKLKEEQRKRFEEEKQRRREEKERRKQEKDLEREKLKEEKKKYAERLRLWNKPREDMECDDLKELPTPVPVRTRLPAQLFGEALMVLEFLRAFGKDFGLKDEFPDGVSLEVLEEALVGCDPEGPLCELLFFFITAIFQALDEEREEVTKDEDLSEAPDDDRLDRSDLAVSAASSSAAAWPPLHLGCSLQEVDLDSCTLSEILRLHILASGADCNHGNAKFRYQKQGGFTLTDDPCVELCLARPALMRRLACTAVYDLLPGEKLAILQALVGKLLSLASSRDLMEDCVEQQRAARQELREVRAEQHRREREEAAHRVRLRKEERQREQEQRLKLKEQEVKDDTKAEVRGSLTTSDPKALRCPLGSLMAEENEEDQDKVRELQERIQKAAACTSLLPLGRDRLYRRYWLLPSASVLFVEEDSFGLTEDMLQPRPKHTQEPSTKMEDAEDGLEEPAEGSVGSSPVPLSSSGPPVSRPNQWFFYSSVEELDQLIDALNPRGHRESGLKEALLQERERLQELLQACERSKYTCADDPESARSVPECTATGETLMETRLRDLLLDMEDRIHQGNLGTLKVMDRHVWRSALESGNYELLCTDEGTDTQVEDMEVNSTPLKALDGPLVDNMADGAHRGNLVHSLARAVAHVERGIERRFLKAPLGEEDSKKEPKTRKSKKKDEDQASEDGSDSSRMVKSVLERWRESLLSSSSLSQVFVHLSSLERSVLWSRSVLNARCRACRRKGDADNMLLCSACGRGHHTHCLRPRLKSVPDGDWFCPDCRPKKPSGRLLSRQHSSLCQEDDKTEEDEESEEEEEKESDEEVVSTRKSQATHPTGRSHHVTPKNSKKSSSKQSGKKATPLPSKASTVASGAKAPPRSATKNTESSSSRISVGRTESCKTATADTTPHVQPCKPVLPHSSSSSRRSSGRNQGVHELSACELLIVELVRHEDSWPFMKLVSRTQVPDYYDIISKPMALSTIREKVNNCQYLSAGEFMADVDLMFSNCLQYNARHTNEAKAGIRLQQFYHSELSRLGLSDRCAVPPAKRSRH